MVGLLYLDTSALMRVHFAEEPESRTVAAFLEEATRSGTRLVSSRLLWVESARTARRRINQGLAGEWFAESVAASLASVTRIEPSPAIFDQAAALVATIRTLDAIHVATALAVRSDLVGVLTYDQTMAEVLEAEGVLAGPVAALR
jgi:predicted nucleic acid-binding protein